MVDGRSRIGVFRVPEPERSPYRVRLSPFAFRSRLWPDANTDSKGQEVFYSIFVAADLFLIGTEPFRAAAYRGPVPALLVLSRHRGWTHTWWAVWLGSASLLIVPYFRVPEALLIGFPAYGPAVAHYRSHLVVNRIT